MREHLFLSNIAAKLRSVAAEGVPDETPEDIRVLLEKLEERERARKAGGEACPGAAPSGRT